MGNKQAEKKTSIELTEHQIDLLKTNTRYNEQEIREWHTRFIQDCPTGRLDKKTFVHIYKEFYPHGKPDKYCQYAFKTFDINNDGLIDFDEFLLAISTQSHGNLDDRLAAAFDIYDISKDGQIDLKELTTIISAMYDLAGETDRKGDQDPKNRAARIIEQFDTSGDKKLSKIEFVIGCKNDPIIRQLLASSTV